MSLTELAFTMLLSLGALVLTLIVISFYASKRKNRNAVPVHLRQYAPVVPAKVLSVNNNVMKNTAKVSTAKKVETRLQSRNMTTKAPASSSPKYSAQSVRIGTSNRSTEMKNYPAFKREKLVILNQPERYQVLNKNINELTFA
ncbi:MAG: hypothetical protein K9I71_05050 [Ignavibacteriales bacterium]|nr:hypothetical protein [Ignavibacteriales bacterium]MCF8315468.1 hypothetical protein [Ignavibacteriales bacterium]MCF8437004.1 hypothetical protein [Ignavibacteriales bacterium]